MNRYPAHRTRATGGLLAPVLLASALLAGLLPGPRILAQSPDGLDELSRRVDSIAPMSGAPGTAVRVTTRDMPVGTPLRVGFGAPSGFEALVELLTGNEGDFDVEIRVPEWATWDRVHFVVAFDVYFRPIARSRPFHVTNEDDLIQRRGRMRAAGDDCRVFRDRDGIDYIIVGPPELSDDLARAASDPDATVTIEGRLEPGGSGPPGEGPAAEDRCGGHPRLVLVRVGG